MDLKRGKSIANAAIFTVYSKGSSSYFDIQSMSTPMIIGYRKDSIVREKLTARHIIRPNLLAYSKPFMKAKRSFGSF